MVNLCEKLAIQLKVFNHLYIDVNTNGSIEVGGHGSAVDCVRAQSHTHTHTDAKCCGTLNLKGIKSIRLIYIKPISSSVCSCRRQ